MIFDWQRVVNDMIARVSGPMHFRLIMQPAMAMFFGIKDGIRDAKEGNPPYFWTIFFNRVDRSRLIKSGLRSVAKVLIFAVILDAIFQLIELRWFYPGEAIIVALLLAFVPYLLIRGPTNRVYRRWTSRHASPHAGYRASKS